MRNDVLLERIGQRDHMVSFAIGPIGKRFEHAHGKPLFHGAHRHQIDSGQRSRISSTQGRLLMRLTANPASPQKNCGDVETTMSGLRKNGAAIVAETR